MSVTNIDSPQLFPTNPSPDFSFEEALHRRDVRPVCGIDEAGRGPLAGPVTAAAVVLDPVRIPDGLHDSKKLSAARREKLFDVILQTSWVSIASVSATTIDRINIREASLLAMTMAARGLEIEPHHALIDGNAKPAGLPCPATTLVKGDARSLSIAAASIIAKVSRDRLMQRADHFYPGYGFARHKGYPTKIHRDYVQAKGPCPLHRLTFAPVADALRKTQKKSPRHQGCDGPFR